MKVLGRTQETRRMFNAISMLGFGSTLMVTWEVILANMLSILTNGGTAGMFCGYLIVILGFTMVYASLAEMASMVSRRNLQFFNCTDFAMWG
jgi:amino acid transporter